MLHRSLGWPASTTVFSLFKIYIYIHIYISDAFISVVFRSSFREKHTHKQEALFVFFVFLDPSVDADESDFEFFWSSRALYSVRVTRHTFWGWKWRSGWKKKKKNFFLSFFSGARIDRDDYLKTAETGSAGQGDVADVGR